MKKIFGKLLLFVLAAALLISCTGCSQSGKAGGKDHLAVSKIYDYVMDAGTYTELDYDYAEKYFAEHNDNWGGACTAVAKTTDNGTMLIGRNMDLVISNKAAYVVRTAVEGCYETVGLTYTYREYSPDYEYVLENGVEQEFARLIPFFSEDVLNSEGLYIEVNMRNSDFWPDGAPKYSCSGTNPESDHRVYVFTLPRYIGEHCATVDEALEYVKTLDLYTVDGYWNYCFMMADATGHYGLLEIAQNKVIWHEGQQAQANFYIDEELAAIEDYQCGVGRYETVMAGIDAVQTRDEMFKLMDSVTYSRSYFPDTCPYDPRSEFIDQYPHWTYAYVAAEENRDEVISAIKGEGEWMKSMSRQEQRDACYFWESSFTEVINCNDRTLFVRFYEDDDLTLTLGFDK